MAKSEKEKLFYCLHCLVEFKVIIEPDHNEEDIKRNYLKSITWLKDFSKCPICDAKLGELD